MAFESDDEPVPRYGPTLPLEFSRILDQNVTARARVLELGLKVWGRPEDDGKLVPHLGNLLHQQRVPESQRDAFRKTYFNAWTRLLGNPILASRALPPDGFLVVSRNDALDVVSVVRPEQAEGDARPVLVDDHADELLSQLTRTLGYATFEIDAKQCSAAIVALRASFGDRVRSMDDLRAQVVVDGSVFAPSESDARLAEGDGEWLGLFASLALEFHASFSSLRSQATRNEMLRRLRRVRIRRVVDIQVEVEGASVVLPEFLHATIGVDDADAPTIIVERRSSATENVWGDLNRLARPMARLIRRPELCDVLELAAIKLTSNRADTEFGGSPTNDEYAVAFGVSAAAVRDIRRALRGSAAAALELLHPVVVYFVGPEEGEPFSPANDDLSTDVPISRYGSRHDRAAPSDRGQRLA